MKKLKNKSDFNLLGAEELYKMSLYAPTIHCAYYSLHQSMMCTILNVQKKSLESFNSEIQNSQISSHNYLIRQISVHLRAKYPNTSTPIERKIKDLKLLREKSDYHDVEINSEMSSKAISLCKELLAFIK